MVPVACAWLGARYNEQEPPVPLHEIADSESDYEAKIMLVTQHIYQDILPSDTESDGGLIAQILLDGDLHRWMRHAKYAPTGGNLIRHLGRNCMSLRVNVGSGVVDGPR